MAQEVLNLYCEQLNSTFANDALKAIDKALEQPAQEPVEVYGILEDGDYISVEVTKEGAIKQCEDMNKHDWNCTYKPLYTHPHQCRCKE